MEGERHPLQAQATRPFPPLASATRQGVGTSADTTDQKGTAFRCELGLMAELITLAFTCRIRMTDGICVAMHLVRPGANN